MYSVCDITYCYVTDFTTQKWLAMDVYINNVGSNKSMWAHVANRLQSSDFILIIFHTSSIHSDVRF